MNQKKIIKKLLTADTLTAKGDVSVSTLFDEIAKEGKAEGIIETGYDFGLSENDILQRLQDKMKISLQQAQEYLEMFGKQTV